MSQIYTKRLAGPRALTAVSASIYTVPAGYSAVVRNVQICNSHPTSTGLCRVGLGGLTNALHVVRTNLAIDSSVFLDLRLALAAGESLHAASEGSTAMAITITGYVFQL